MIIPLLIGAVAIFIWSQFTSKKPVEKTEILESPLPETKKDIIDVFKENVPKITAILGGGGAALAAGGKIVTGGIKAGWSPLTGGLAAAPIIPTIPAVALPAATVLPSGLAAMAPTTLTSAVYTAPAVVGTGAGTSSVGAGVGGSAGLGATALGAAAFVAPAILMVGIAKVLDALSPKKPPSPERLAAEAEAKKFTNLMVSTGSMSYDPKTGFVDDPDDPSAFPGGK